MARGVQGCHKCLSEEEKASINTSCFFVFADRSGKGSRGLKMLAAEGMSESRGMD